MEPNVSRNGQPDDSARDGETGEPGASTPSADELFHALAAEPRRRVLGALLDESPKSVDVLAALLTDREAGTDGELDGTTERRRVHAGLYHAHLPLLEDVGLVTRGADGGLVHLGSVDERVREIVRVAVEYEGREAAELSA